MHQFYPSNQLTIIAGRYVLKVVAACVLALLLMAGFQTISVHADGSVTIKVIDQQCPGYAQKWSYNSVETAVEAWAAATTMIPFTLGLTTNQWQRHRM